MKGIRGLCSSRIKSSSGTNDVVPVLVLDALEHVSVELAHHLLLLLGRDGLQRLLDDAAAVHL